MTTSSFLVSDAIKPSYTLIKINACLIQKSLWIHLTKKSSNLKYSQYIYTYINNTRSTTKEHNRQYNNNSIPL